jgi:hypothetical protein
MISLTKDPTDHTKLVLTATVTLYLDRILVETLSDEIEKAIRLQATKDVKSNKEVRDTIAKAATNRLLDMLAVQTEPPNT